MYMYIHLQTYSINTNAYIIGFWSKKSNVPFILVIAAIVHMIIIV